MLTYVYITPVDTKEEKREKRTKPEPLSGHYASEKEFNGEEERCKAAAVMPTARDTLAKAANRTEWNELPFLIKGFVSAHEDVDLGATEKGITT